MNIERSFFYSARERHGLFQDPKYKIVNGKFSDRSYDSIIDRS